MGNYRVMRNLFLAIISLLATFPIFAPKTAEVSFRYSRQDDTTRMVFEADDTLIKDTNTVVSLSVINVEFPVQVEIKKPKDFPFEMTIKGRFLVINLQGQGVTDIKTSKLTSPARLVFDLKTFPKRQKEPIQQAQPRPQPGAIQQPGQEKQQGNGQQQMQKLPPPAGQPVEKARKIIVIDPGHGGYEYGIVSRDIKEKDVNLNLAKELGDALAKKGRKVFLTRRTDQSASISDRIDFSNGKNPDVFVSIHASRSDSFAVYVAAVEDLKVDDAAKLYSLFTRQNRHIGKSRALSTAIGESLKNEFRKDVFIRELPLPVLYSMNASAVLIEYPSLQSFSSDPKMRGRFANAVLKGISAYEQ
jgi:N-acetylmuramoyl-L-alanine amidase